MSFSRIRNPVLEISTIMENLKTPLRTLTTFPTKNCERSRYRFPGGSELLTLPTPGSNFVLSPGFARRNRELKRRRRRRQRERQKSNRFILAKEQLCTCFTLFCTFLCRRMRKCLISPLVEDENTRQQLSFFFSLPEL